MEEADAFVFLDSDGELAAVVEGRIALEEIDPASGGSALGIDGAEDNAVGAAVDDGAGAHRAGLFGDVEGAAFESPVAVGGLSGSEGDHFSVGGGVLESLDLVPSAGDDLFVADDDGADGHFSDFVGTAGFAKSLAHEEAVALEVDREVVGHDLMTHRFQEPCGADLASGGVVVADVDAAGRC